jgi:hypothetical protein
MRPSKMTRAEKNIAWVQKFCRVPSGPRRGEYVRLTKQQRLTLFEIYDAPGALRQI